MKLFVLMSSNCTKHWGVINIKNMWTQMPSQICIVIFQSRNHEKMGSSQAEVWTSMYKKLCDSLFLNSSSAKASSFQPFTYVWLMTFCGNAWEIWSTCLVFHWCYSFIFFQFLPYYMWSTGNPAGQHFSSSSLFWGRDVDGDSNLGWDCS